jgi:hypothetical protein
VSGTIADSQSGELLLNATIQEGYSGTVSNQYGFFSLSLPKGEHTLQFSFVGYSSQKIVVDLEKDSIIHVLLFPSTNLEEITVNETKSSLVQGVLPGSYTMSSKQISQLPVLLGEADLIKAIQLLPGVQACNEASGSLMVRGGGADGNLILLDDVPIFNVSHLWGLFSVFDPNAIKSLEFYNGGFPSKYGGRSSSVLDLRLKDGNKYEHHGNVSVGVVASKIFMEGPIIKGKSSFIFSARRTYLDGLSAVYQKIKYKNYDRYRNGFYFYDLIGKISWDIGTKDRLFFSVYTGTDKNYSIEEKDTSSILNSTIKWGNITSAIRWNHKWTPKLFSNITATHTLFNYYVDRKGLDSDSIEYALNNFNYTSNIRDLGVKLDASYYCSQQLKVDFGAFVSKKFYNTGQSEYFIQRSRDATDTSTVFYSTPLLESFESGAYVMANFSLFHLVDPALGVRMTSYKQGDEAYVYVEPRMSIKIAPDAIPVEINGAYTIMHQTIQLLSNYGISLPIDLWIPATSDYEPVQSEQISAGIDYLPNNDFRFSLNAYLKTMSNLVDYEVGEAFSPTDLNWEEKICIGKGRSKGIEFLAEKQSGKLTGWLSYTLSKTENRFDGINDGTWYPSTYDHRHEVHVVGNYILKEGVRINFVWLFATGSAITVPESKYYCMTSFLTQTVQDALFTYTERNGSRMPSYHRLDGGISFTKYLKQGKRTWSMGAYNLYNRKNPYYLSVTTNNRSELQYDTNSMLSFIPYLTYSYEF